MQETWRLRFHPWVWKIPWRRAWQPPPAVSPGGSHGQRSLVGCSPWGRKEFSSVQSLSRVWLFATPWTAARQASLSITNPDFTQTHVHRVGDAVQPSHPLSSPSPPAFNLSQHQGLFKWVSSLHQVARVLSFSFSISPSNANSGLISFRMDWLDLLAVQGTLKSLLQHHSSKASVFRHSAFFIVQLSHPYMTTRKTIALTRGTFAGKVMSLLFNTLSALGTTFLPRINCLLISVFLSCEPKGFSSCDHQRL